MTAFTESQIPLIGQIREKLNYGGPEIKLYVNTRLRTTFGRARGHKNEIEIALKLWEEADKEQKIQLIHHEVAHVIAFNWYGPKVGHGWQWKNLMWRLGRKADRCHNLEIEKPGRVNLTCICGNKMSLTKYVQALINQGDRKYWCRKCKRTITPAAIIAAKQNVGV